MVQLPARTRVGISNVVLPGSKKTFPENFQQQSRLHYYASIFKTLEVNSSFYKTPLQSTYRKWSLDVPDDFQFSIKLTKQITHIKDLACDLSDISPFMNAAEGIGGKKGCILIQLPGKITLDYFKRVEEIMSALSTQDPNNSWRKAVEFRNHTWYIAETFEMLDEFEAAVVLNDFPKGRFTEPRSKAPFIYIRFHGPKGDYRDSYSDNYLETKATEIRKWQKEGKDVYAYFNNTIGNAFENAVTLKNILI